MAEKEKKKKMTPVQIRESLNQIKKTVFDLEQNNDSHIFVYYSGNKWYKIGGRSALIYYHILAPQVPKYKPQIRPDGDFKFKFETGVISVRDIEALKKRLETIKVVPDKDFDTGNKFVLAFKLPEKIDAKKMDKILGRKEAKRREVEDLLSVANADPALAALARELEKIAYDFVKNINALDRDLVGRKLLDRNAELFETYRKWAMGRVEYEAGLAEILRVIDDLAGYLLIIIEHDIGDFDKMAFYTFKLEELREGVLKRLDGMIKDSK